MSERTVLVDEEMPVDKVAYHTGVPGMDAVVLDGSGRIATVDDPWAPDFYDLWDCPQAPAVVVPEGTVRDGDRLRVRVELVRGGDDGYDAKP